MAGWSSSREAAIKLEIPGAGPASRPITPVPLASSPQEIEIHHRQKYYEERDHRYETEDNEDDL